MKVSQLITELHKMPPDAEVLHLWDGALRTYIEFVWLTRTGVVGTGDTRQVCYDTDDRPMNAPTEQENKYWHTPSDRGGEHG